MKKFYLSLLIIFIISATPVLAVSKTNSSQPKKSAPITSAKKSKPLASPIKTIWSPPTPKDYTPITWAQAPGIASFSKTPKNNGTIDFLTYIHLPQNQIKFIFSTSTPINSNSKHPDTDSTIATSSNAKENLSAVITDISDFNNLSLQRLGAEVAKAIAPSIKFLWDAQFFNMKSPFSDLSMAIKYSIGTTTTIVSGSRSVPDMAEPRRMLVINNQIGSATIKDFDSNFFISSKNGDQALEGFSPTVAKSDNASAAASRLFLGVSNNGRELAVYCSRMATVAEA
ncbi:MAG: hypothetical protein NT091_04675, partial [Candidatus Falkowbacteria bacterium]|nr:hypothetical protein [Candidatus Falkowbacteria bacterium]